MGAVHQNPTPAMSEMASSVVSFSTTSGILARLKLESTPGDDSEEEEEKEKLEGVLDGGIGGKTRDGEIPSMHSIGSQTELGICSPNGFE